MFDFGFYMYFMGERKGMDRKADKFPLNLFCSLMLLSFIPFVYTLVRTNLIADSSLPHGLSIAGHIEWFDLINETIQAFLIVPLYALFNKCMQDPKKFKEQIFQSFFIVNVVYIAFSVLVLTQCRHIVTTMVVDHVSEVTRYFELETIGFIVANVVSFVNVLFVVLNRPFYIYGMVILKTLFTIMGDLILIPRFGVNGAAYTNILVSLICVVLCVILVIREKLIAVSFRFERVFIKEYLIIGLFSGFQILLDNLIYSVLVCKMVNAVEEQGSYWIANNIIWGLMLIPILALAELIKKDCKNKITRVRMKQYNIVILVTFLAWLCFVPMLNIFLKNIMGIEDFGSIRRILVILIPFYLAYNYTVLLDNILIGHGKTYFCFAISAIVNLVYYPIMYILLSKGVFVPDLTFICMMFGFGMVVHLGCSVVCFVVYKGRFHETVEVDK